MIGAFVFFVDFGGFEILLEGFRNEEVVDAPANVVFASFTPMAPPSVTLFFWVQGTKSIDKVGIDEISDSLSFFVGKASVVVVGLGTSKIDLVMSGIEIATNYHGLGLF